MPEITVGAALALQDIPRYRDWLFEAQRDIELQDFFTAEVLNGDWRPAATEIRTALDGHTGRLGIHGPFWGFSTASRDPDVRALVARRMQQGLDVCAAVGATQMVIHSPYTTWDYRNMDCPPCGYRGMIEEFAHDTLAAAVRRAETEGVTLVMENIEDMVPAHRRQLVDSFGSEALKLSVDTGHAHFAHVTHGAPPVDYFVADAGAQLHHVHLQDVDGYADRHWSVGEGTICWDAVFRAIAACGPQLRAVLELRDKSMIPASMRFITARGLAL